MVTRQNLRSVFSSTLHNVYVSVINLNNSKLYTWSSRIMYQKCIIENTEISSSLWNVFCKAYFLFSFCVGNDYWIFFARSQQLRKSHIEGHRANCTEMVTDKNKVYPTMSIHPEFRRRSKTNQNIKLYDRED